MTPTRSSLVSYNRKKQKQHADKQCLFSKYLTKRNQHLRRIYSCTIDPMETIDTTFSFQARLSVLRTETSHLRWNLFVFDGSNGLFRRTFDPLTRLDDIFLSVLRTETPLMSDGMYLCLMDPMDSIGTTFDPFLWIDDIFLSVSRTETQHVRWNLFVPDGSDGLLRTETPQVRWSLVDSIGQLSTFSYWGVLTLHGVI